MFQGSNASIKLGQLGLKRVIRLWRASGVENSAFGVHIGRMEKSIALSVVVAIIVFAATYAAVTVQRIKGRHVHRRST